MHHVISFAFLLLLSFGDIHFICCCSLFVDIVVTFHSAFAGVFICSHISLCCLISVDRRYIRSEQMELDNSSVYYYYYCYLLLLLLSLCHIYLFLLLFIIYYCQYQWLGCAIHCIIIILLLLLF